MNKKILIFVTLIFITSSCSLHKDDSIGIIDNKLDYNVDCIITESVKEVRSVSMQPMILPGEELILLEGYYDCNQVKRGDVVAYDSASSEYPIIKQVKTIGGDILEFRDSNLLVNNEVMKNSVGDIYEFGVNERKMISLYIKDGKLKEDTYMIFGDNIYSSIDSRKFGAVGKNGFIGKFIIEKNN